MTPVEYYAKTGWKRCDCVIGDMPFMIEKCWQRVPTRRKRVVAWHVLCPVCKKIIFIFLSKARLKEEFKKHDLKWEMK